MARRAFLLAALLLTSCVEPAKVELVNASGAVIGDLVVVAKGATARVGNLNPHESRTVSICPSGKSSLALEFIARGAQRSATAKSVIECSAGFRVRLEIEPDFSVHSSLLR